MKKETFGMYNLLIVMYYIGSIIFITFDDILLGLLSLILANLTFICKKLDKMI